MESGTLGLNKELISFSEAYSKGKAKFGFKEKKGPLRVKFEVGQLVSWGCVLKGPW